MTNTPSFSQTAYRWYEDGSENASADAGCAINTALQRYLDGDQTLGLRIRLQITNAVSGASTDDFQLQYSKNGGAFTNLTTSTTDVKAVDSTNLTDQAATTNRLGAGSGSFVAGLVSEDGLADNKQVTASNYSEFLYTVRLVAANLADNDVITFRVLRNGSTMTYTVTPQVTVKVPGATAGNSTAIVKHTGTNVIHHGGSIYEIVKCTGAAATYDADAVSSTTITGDQEIILEYLGAAGQNFVAGFRATDPTLQVNTSGNWVYVLMDGVNMYLVLNGTQIGAGQSMSGGNKYMRLTYTASDDTVRLYKSTDRATWGSALLSTVVGLSTTTFYFDSSLDSIAVRGNAQHFAPAAAQDLTPSLFSNTQTFYSPTVSAKNTLAPSLYSDADTFPTPTVTPGPVILAPSFYSDPDTFFTPVVSSAQNLVPSLYADPDTFYTPTVSAKNALTPALYSNAQTFYVPTVSAKNTLLPPLYTNAPSFPTPTVTTSYAVTAPLFVNGQTFYAPTVTSLKTLSPTLFSDPDTFFTPIVTRSSVAGAKPRVVAMFFR